MAILSATLSNLACYHQEFLTFDDEESFVAAAARLISKVRTIAALSYRRSRGLPYNYPDPRLHYCANFLHMMFSIPHVQYEASPKVVRALTLFLMLHADHEQNCSTSTVRMAGSSGANPYSAIAAGISALWGPAHGGANEAVLTMLAEIGDVSQIDKYIAKAKDKNDPFRLMGFGHRVYKNFDPRATIIREMCHKVLKQLGSNDSPMFELALELDPEHHHDVGVGDRLADAASAQQAGEPELSWIQRQQGRARIGGEPGRPGDTATIAGDHRQRGSRFEPCIAEGVAPSTQRLP